MDTITVYIDKKAYNGFITVNVWHSKDQMYPLLWHKKFLDYTIPEIKKIIKNRIAEKCKKCGYNNNYKIEFIEL